MQLIWRIFSLNVMRSKSFSARSSVDSVSLEGISTSPEIIVSPKDAFGVPFRINAMPKKSAVANPKVVGSHKAVLLD
jgi:hypothetical protein